VDKALSLLRTLADERRSNGSLVLLMRVAKRINPQGREI